MKDLLQNQLQVDAMDQDQQTSQDHPQKTQKAANQRSDQVDAMQRLK